MEILMGGCRTGIRKVKIIIIRMLMELIEAMEDINEEVKQIITVGVRVALF